MCVVILRPSAMKYVVFSDSYVSRLGRLDLSLCLPGEVRFFGRGGMRFLHVPNDEWRQMSTLCLVIRMYLDLVVWTCRYACPGRCGSLGVGVCGSFMYLMMNGDR